MIAFLARAIFHESLCLVMISVPVFLFLQNCLRNGRKM